MTEFAIGGAPGGEDVFGGRPLLPELRHHHRPNTPTTDLDQRGPTANYTALRLAPDDHASPWRADRRGASAPAAQPRRSRTTWVAAPGRTRTSTTQSCRYR